MERIQNSIVLGDNSDNKDKEEGESGNSNNDLTSFPCNHHWYQYCMPCNVYKNDDDNKDNVELANKSAAYGPPETNDPENNINRPPELEYFDITQHLNKENSMQELIKKIEQSTKKNAPENVPVRKL